MANIAEVDLKIKAVEFVLGSFIDCESEEQRQLHLRQQLTEIPGLKTYVNYSEKRLQDEKKQLQDLKMLFMRQLEAETRLAPQTGKLIPNDYEVLCLSFFSTRVTFSSL